MGDTSKKITTGPVANTKRVTATKNPAAKKTAEKKAKKPAVKPVKKTVNTERKGVVQAPKTLEKVVNKKPSLWRKVKKALGL